MRISLRNATLALALFPLVCTAAETGKVFAAPAAAASLPSSGAGGIGQVTVALLLVLAAVFAAAWLMRRLRNLAGGSTAAIEVVSQVALGARERAVIVRVGKTQLLLGVAQGQVSMLHVLPEDAVPTGPTVAPTGEKPNFASLLKKSLGR